MTSAEIDNKTKIVEKAKKKTKKIKTVSQTLSIKAFYEKVLENSEDLFFKENEDINKIITDCQQAGQFIFKKDDLSTWYFIRSSYKDRKCIRMIFVLSGEEGGKVHNVEKIMKLLSNVEEVLTVIDNSKIYKHGSYMILDAIKYEEF